MSSFPHFKLINVHEYRIIYEIKMLTNFKMFPVSKNVREFVSNVHVFDFLLLFQKNHKF